MTARMMADPPSSCRRSSICGRTTCELWQSTGAPHARPGGRAGGRARARRPALRDPAWDENAVFDFIKQSYLLTARWMQRPSTRLEGLDDKTAQKVDFYTRQFVDAMAPIELRR